MASITVHGGGHENCLLRAIPGAVAGLPGSRGMDAVSAGRLPQRYVSAQLSAAVSALSRVRLLVVELLPDAAAAHSGGAGLWVLLSLSVVRVLLPGRAMLHC